MHTRIDRSIGRRFKQRDKSCSFNLVLSLLLRGFEVKEDAGKGGANGRKISKRAKAMAKPA